MITCCNLGIGLALLVLLGPEIVTCDDLNFVLWILLSLELVQSFQRAIGRMTLRRFVNGLSGAALLNQIVHD